MSTQSPRRFAVLDAFTVGLASILLTSAVLDQRVGLSGMYDQLAAADQSMSESQWWALPAVDAIAVVMLVLPLVSAGLRWRRRPGLVQRQAASCADAFAWLGVHIAVVSLGASLISVLGVTTRTLPWPWVWATVIVFAVVIAERSRDSRPDAGIPIGPLRSGATSGLFVLVAGAAGPGLVAVATVRLLAEPASRMLRPRQHQARDVASETARKVRL